MRRVGFKTAKNGPTRRVKPKKVSRPKWRFKKSDLRKLDDHFSLRIRNRDKKCQFPNCQVVEIGKLQASHYEGRARWETRFDEENMIALCWFHHYKSKLLGYEYQKQREEKHGFDGQYTKHMKALLGEARFLALINKPKQSRKDAMEEYKQKILSTLETGFSDQNQLESKEKEVD